MDSGECRSGIGPAPPAEPDAEGLARHPSLNDRFDPAVRIVEHDPGWAVTAAGELDRVEDALGRVVVQLDHVGSTAVPGLAAKPIIDLQVAVAALDPRSRYVRPLERLGYLFIPDPQSPDFHLFARPPERPRSYHLHVCVAGSGHQFRHIAVRDFLRGHHDQAPSYAAMKRELVKRHPQHRLAYIAAKEDYVSALEARALASASRGRR